MSMCDAITLAIAAIGAVLGIMSTWQQMSKDRVRLKVRPCCALPIGLRGTGQWTLSIDVVNLSAFPVTVDELGLELVTKERLPNITRPTNRGALPVRLEPREALTVIYDPDLKQDPRLSEVHRAYARCQCGTVEYGTSPALKQLVQEAKARRDGNPP